MSTLFKTIVFLILLLPVLAISVFTKTGLKITKASTGCTYYVATDGNDNNIGTSVNQPFETIQKGLQAVSAGETICVRNGNYINANSRSIRIDKSGQPNNPITIKGYQNEKPRLDGQYRYPKYDPSSSHECVGNKSKGDGKEPDTRYMNYSNLVKITGSWINFEGFDITGSTGRGIYIEDTHHITIKNSKIYSNRGGAIRAMESIQGNDKVHHITIQNNEIYDNTNYCTYKRQAQTGLPWPGTISLSHTHHSIIRGNKVYQNYGQGLHPIELEHVLIEDNQIWDNDGVQVHIDCVAYPIIQRNLIYRTPGGMGIMGINISVDNRYGNEASDPVMKQQVIVNNILIGNIMNLDFHEKDGKKKGALIDAVIANNAFINAKIVNTTGHFNIKILDPDEASENHQNVKFENNIIIQDENPENIFRGPSRNRDAFTWNHNIWSTSPPDFARGRADIILDEAGIDPETVLNNYRANLVPGQTNPNWFALKTGSAAINQGRVFADGEFPGHVFDTLDDNPLTIDYFLNLRDGQPDIGAHEYSGTSTLLGDIDGSGKVNALDFAYLVSKWGSTDNLADLDDSGIVNHLDAAILLGNYGKES
jgi:hypothetical protein